jgi:hypothetical protein
MPSQYDRPYDSRPRFRRQQDDGHGYLEEMEEGTSSSGGSGSGRVMFEEGKKKRGRVRRGLHKVKKRTKEAYKGRHKNKKEWAS